MAYLSHVDLVQNSFPLICDIATSIACRLCHWELGKLGAYLCTFALETVDLDPSQKLALEKSTFIHQLLGEIEGIVSGINPPHQTRPYATLRAIAHTHHATDGIDATSNTLPPYLEKRVRGSITSLVHQRWDFARVVTTLQARSSIHDHELPDDLDQAPTVAEPSDYPRQLRILYNVLRRHSPCKCPTQPSSIGHLAKLRLTLSPQHTEDQVKFDMLFSSYPDPSWQGRYDWQPVQIMVPRSSRRRIRFTDGDANEGDQSKNSTPVEEGGFCDLLSSRCETCLHLKVSSDQLHILLDDHGPRRRIESRAGVSLGTALEQFGLRYGMRPILAYIFARSFWQYYASDWMKSLWTSHTIFFMAENNDQRVVSHFWNPYQLIQFLPDGGDNVEYRPEVGMMHRYPRVLALGAMMIELATGKSIPGEEVDLQRCSARTSNSHLRMLREVLETAHLADDCKLPRFKEVVRKCLDPGLFKNAQPDKINRQENIEHRRRILYQEIVSPLKQLIEGTGWDMEFKGLDRIPLVPKDLNRPTSLQSYVTKMPASDSSLPMSQAAQTHAMSKYTPRLEDYAIGWISALRIEYVAALELLDEEHVAPSNIPSHDENAYRFGRIGHHNIVLSCMPKGKYGVTSAASVANHMLRSFPNLRIGLMVGIGGGAPTKMHDIRLGDVVVSTPTGQRGGVIHYNFGKAIQDKTFQQTGQLNSSPLTILNCLHDIETLHERRGHDIDSTVTDMIQANNRLIGYQRPDPMADVLYDSSFVHSDNSQDCASSCIRQKDKIVHRSNREPDHVLKVHYGLIASADHLMKDAHVRDHLAETEDVLCFEMEAAGLMDRFPCVVIRGICDYSDTHKNDKWQKYAAATAAAYAKELLGVIRR